MGTHCDYEKYGHVGPYFDREVDRSRATDDEPAIGWRPEERVLADASTLDDYRPERSAVPKRARYGPALPGRHDRTRRSLATIKIGERSKDLSIGTDALARRHWSRPAGPAIAWSSPARAAITGAKRLPGAQRLAAMRLREAAGAARHGLRLPGAGRHVLRLPVE